MTDVREVWCVCKQLNEMRFPLSSKARASLKLAASAKLARFQAGLPPRALPGNPRMPGNLERLSEHEGAQASGNGYFDNTHATSENRFVTPASRGSGTHTTIAGAQPGVQVATMTSLSHGITASRQVEIQ